MSRDVLGPAFNMKDAFNDVAISLAHGADEHEVIARLDRLLDRYGSLGGYGRSDRISFRFLTDELGELRAYGLILPTVFLCIVAFLLNVLLSRLVSTQRGQVAVLKAFGYTNIEIGLHYLELALATVTAGTITGVGLGLWLASGMMHIYARYFHFPELRLQADARLILLAVAIAAGSACLGAISAASRHSRSFRRWHREWLDGSRPMALGGGSLLCFRRQYSGASSGTSLRRQRSGRGSERHENKWPATSSPHPRTILPCHGLALRLGPRRPSTQSLPRRRHR